MMPVLFGLAAGTVAGVLVYLVMIWLDASHQK
jgi:hypothetical protein